ncbi:MAG: Gfo/Idh/MocA family oxidoreductase [Kiritimatiellae bacterium]|nr:Gfo/Idh/MocA family oxidoreductase [Kiritimatiellia bacterium]
MTTTTRRDFLRTTALAGAGMAALSTPKQTTAAAQTAAPQGGTAMGLTAPKLDLVRIGLIGVGARGSGHLGDLLKLDGVLITALCDTHAPTLQRAAKRVVGAGRPEPALYGAGGDEDYKRLLARDDVDAVYISTPWEWHVPMSVDAMQAGKHALVEVPAALTVEDCWKLVDVCERTRKHCMMLENVNYGREELMALNMCRQGLFGDLLHGEAAYIHELRSQMFEVEHGTGSWRTYHYAKRNGNLYPTHGLGPVAQYMGINQGDRFDYLSSVSSPALGRPAFAREKFPADHKWNRIPQWTCGDISTTLVKTALGRTIMIQWDETSPRPYSRHNLIQGTRGTFAGFPDRIAVDYAAEELPEPVRAALGDRKRTNYHEWDQTMEPWYKAYDHPLWIRLGEEAKRVGGHGGMDFVMNWRLVYCLRNGLPLDQTVYDAAAWSVITPLSEWSVNHRSQSVDVPDFTRGVWKTTPPFAVVS